MLFAGVANIPKKYITGALFPHLMDVKRLLRTI